VYVPWIGMAEVSSLIVFSFFVTSWCQKAISTKEEKDEKCRREGESTSFSILILTDVSSK